MAEPRFALEPLFGAGKNELVAHVPHCGKLGITVVEAERRAATVRLPYDEGLVGNPATGVVFGGVITTLLDQASGLAVFCSLETLRAIATLDLRVDYLRAAKPGCDLIGRAECYRMARKVAFVRGIAYESDPADPFASSIATFMLGANAAETPLSRLVDEEEASR